MRLYSHHQLDVSSQALLQIGIAGTYASVEIKMSIRPAPGKLNARSLHAASSQAFNTVRQQDRWSQWLTYIPACIQAYVHTYKRTYTTDTTYTNAHTRHAQLVHKYVLDLRH